MLKAEVMRPSALGPAERAAWSGLVAANPDLHRAFFAPGFALACEAAHGRAHVAVLHEGGRIRAFFPFQFASPWRARLRLAERIGGNFADNAGLIAEAGFAITPQALLGRCGLAQLFISELSEAQRACGLEASEWHGGYLIELDGGSAAYFAALAARHREWTQNTARKQRRIAREIGPLSLVRETRPSAAALAPLIAAKREQYRRTGVPDPFVAPQRMRLLQALSDDAAPDCTLELTTLFAGERVIAQHLGLLCHGALSWWFPVYDPALAKLSPGRLLLWQMIGAAEANGLCLIDCGEGEQDYKRQFSTRPARYGRANWSAGTWRSAAARLWQVAAWRLARHRGAPAQRDPAAASAAEA
jgi:CelD/BcsL family acetyltransferase involved in cellulose biosynthesis